ncbi:hypothetical protein BJV77DRAFT_968412, partial [Russula vinacea]
MQSDDSPQTVHFVPLPPVASLAKVPAWQLALDTIGLFRILLLLVVAHAAAIVLHLAIVIYRLRNPLSEVYDFFSDESPEYFDYDADHQGLGRISIGSPVQLAQVPAAPRSTLFSFEEFAAAVALAHPLPGPVASAPVSPSLSYASLSGVSSPLSLPTELSLPASWADRSPSPIDYEGISEWAEEAAEADPPALPHFAVFHWGIENPEAPFVLENPAPAAEPAPVAAPEVFAGPLEFTFPAVEPVQSPPAEQSPPSQSTPRPVFEEPLLPSPQSPVPASPRPLSPLPAEEEARLENQENVPPEVAGPIFACPLVWTSITTSYGPEWRPRSELSLGDALEFPTVTELIRWAPRFPSVIPFRGAATHHFPITPVIPNITAQFTIPPIYACSKAIKFPPTLELPLGYIKYSFRDRLREVFSPFSLLVKSAFSGAPVILETVDFLDGRR